MKILSKFKDYYDHLVGTFGVDENAVYVRNTECCGYDLRAGCLANVGGPEPVPGEIFALAFCGKIYVTAFYDGKFHFGKNIDVKCLNKYENERIGYSGYSKSDMFLAVDGMPTTVNDDLKSPIIYMDASYWDNADAVKFKVKIKSVFDSNYGKAIFPSKVKESFAERTIFLIPKYTNVQMSRYGLGSLINPTEAFVAITNHLLKIPEVKTIQSNDGKIQSHGFDLKTSFRKKKQ